MNRRLIGFIVAVAGIVFSLSACKKSSSSTTSDALLVDYHLSGNLGVTTLPCTVKLVADVPEGADQITWVFPDSSTVTGDSITHTFTKYGEYMVQCKAVKGDRSGSLTKGVPVTIYRKLQIRSIGFKQTEPYSSGTFAWDDFNGKPDLAYRITTPDGMVYTTQDQYILYDRDTGALNTIPTVYANRLDGTVKIEVLDVDTGETPKYVFMGGVSFYIGDYVLPATPYDTKIQLQKDLTKLEVGVSWVQ